MPCIDSLKALSSTLQDMLKAFRRLFETGFLTPFKMPSGQVFARPFKTFHVKAYENNAFLRAANGLQKVF